MSNSINELSFGYLDTSYKEAGGKEGLRILSTGFYKIMDEIPEAKIIRDMHEEDLALMIDKLTLFLSMWLGGPKTYQSKYGVSGMPKAHQHLIINEPERDSWLMCMDQAIDKQKYREIFKVYLKEQFRFSAEMIRTKSKMK